MDYKIAYSNKKLNNLCLAETCVPTGICSQFESIWRGSLYYFHWYFVSTPNHSHCKSSFWNEMCTVWGSSLGPLIDYKALLPLALFSWGWTSILSEPPFGLSLVSEAGGDLPWDLVFSKLLKLFVTFPFFEGPFKIGWHNNSLDNLQSRVLLMQSMHMREKCEGWRDKNLNNPGV